MKRTLLISLLALTTVTLQAQRHHNEHGGHRPPEHRPVLCATPEQMAMTMQVLKQQSFDDKKLEIARLCVTLGHFCVDDLARMAAVFSFDDNRLQFLIYAYDYCEDPQNYYALRDSFTFRSNYESMMDAIRSDRRIPSSGRPNPSNHPNPPSPPGHHR